MNIYLCILCKEESYNDGRMCDECLDKISKDIQEDDEGITEQLEHKMH